MKGLLILLLLTGRTGWGRDRVSIPGLGAEPARPALTEEEKRTYSAHLESGRALLARDYLDSAIVELQAAIKLKPDSIAAHDLLGQALIRAGNWAATITTYQRLMRLAPTETRFHRLLLQVTGAYAMPKQEADALERLLAVEPDEKEMLTRLAKVYGEALSNPAKRVWALEKLSKLSPQDPAVWRDLMEGYEALRRPKEALAARERLAALEPKNLETQVDLAEAYAASQRPDLEVALYARLLASAPNDSDLKRELALAYGHLAEDQAARGFYSRAWKTYQQALSLAPGDPVLIHGLAELGREFHPRLEVVHESGSAGKIRFLRHRVATALRLKRTETTLEVSGIRRQAREYDKRGATEQARAGATQRLWREWFAGAMGGRGGQGAVYSAKIERRDENFSLRLKHELDYIYETPQGIVRHISRRDNVIEGAMKPHKLLGATWEFKWGRYSDVNWEQSLTWGVEGTLWEQKPYGHRFTLAYSESRLRHNRQLDDSPYFSPIRYLSSYLRPGWEWRNPNLSLGAHYSYGGDSSSVKSYGIGLSAEGRINRWLEASAGFEKSKYSGARGVSGGTGDDLLRVGLGARW